MGGINEHFITASLDFLNLNWEICIKFANTHIVIVQALGEQDLLPLSC